MKPIRLRFSGMQSYREEQDIDFAELGTVGIFGVFGPTGAGKSTILDAITLALFGKVERAKSGTRGILNQFEDKLSVSFEFSLGGDTYLAERLYARDKSDRDSVRNRHARLVRLSPVNQVLADKSSDMDNKVAGLLGMSFDDFSRAVILPQGRFDQFLKLTGGDRAKMLENILRLERYGERLWERASRSEKSLGQEIHTDQKLLEQLGDASAEALSQAEEKLVLQDNMVLKKEEQKKAAEKALRELEQLAELSSEFASLQQQQAELETLKDQMDNDRALLERALKAEPLRELLKQEAELTANQNEEESRVNRQQALCTGIGVNLQQAEEGVARTKEAEETLQNLREQVLPKVMLALDYEKQIRVSEQELQSINENLHRKQGELETLTKDGKEKRQRYEQAKAERDKLVPRKQLLAQALAVRPRIEKAVGALVDLETAEQMAREAELTVSGRQKALAAEVKKLLTKLSEHIDRTEMDKHREDPVHLSGQVPEIAERAKKSLAKAQEAYDSLVMQNMAGTLAGRLSPGAPCPVCGSQAHPQPAAGPAENDGALADAKNEIQAARIYLDEVMAWEREAGLAYNTMRTIADEISAVHLVNLETKKAALRSVLTKWQEHAAQLSACLPQVQSVAGMPSLDRTTVRAAKTALDHAEEEYKGVETKLEARDNELRSLEGELNWLKESYLGHKYDAANLQSNAKAAGDAGLRLKTALAEITGGSSAVEFQQKTNDKILVLQKEIAEAKTALDNARSEKQEADNNLAALKAGLEKTKAHLTKVSASLQNSMSRQGFHEKDMLRAALLSEDEQQKIRKRLEDYVQTRDFVARRVIEVEAKLKDKPFEPEQIDGVRHSLLKLQEDYEEAVREQGALKKSLLDLKNRQAEWQRLKAEISRLEERRELAAKLVSLLKGRKLVQFLAEEHLRDMAAEASLRLAGLTGQRYALELDEDCSFVMRDDYNGGQRRPVNTLSGGETFLTSLSLALALSSKIQLRGQYPLGFFFLDEGFGTLDPEKLEVVVNTLEKLHDGQRVVGIITHVPELRSRMPRYLEILPAANDGSGSTVVMKKS